MKTPIVNLDDFAALDPFFRIIQRGLDGRVRLSIPWTSRCISCARFHPMAVIWRRGER
jgi:hypothetical protein